MPARIGRLLAELFFPSRCSGCGRWGAFLCERCVQRAPLILPPYCSKCGRPLETSSSLLRSTNAAKCELCREFPLTIDGIRSAYLLTGALRKAVHDFKYRGVSSLAPVLGRLLAEYVRENRIVADFVVPVPLHESRRKERGYDQAELLGAVLSKESGMSLARGWLERVRPTVPQVKTASAIERRRNVAGAFSSRPTAKAESSVLLVDDVCTTGATLNACALALKEAGVKRVAGLTLAREA